jgi:hypothetical protein
MSDGLTEPVKSAGLIFSYFNPIGTAAPISPYLVAANSWVKFTGYVFDASAGTEQVWLIPFEQGAWLLETGLPTAFFYHSNDEQIQVGPFNNETGATLNVINTNLPLALRGGSGSGGTSTNITLTAAQVFNGFFNVASFDPVATVTLPSNADLNAYNDAKVGTNFMFYLINNQPAATGSFTLLVDGGNYLRPETPLNVACGESVAILYTSASGNFYLAYVVSQGVPGRYWSTNTVAQATDISTAVTLHTRDGMITTQTASASPILSESFTVNNGYVTADSIVHLTVNSYSGTTPTDGTPVLYAENITAGSFDIIINTGAVAALNGTMNIGFSVVN